MPKTIRVLSVNTWGGRVEGFFEFIKKMSKIVHVFCLQEVLSYYTNQLDGDGAIMNLFEELKKLLPHYQNFFSPTHEGWACNNHADIDNKFGNAVFSRLPVLNYQTEFVHREYNSFPSDGFGAPRNIQILNIAGNLRIINFHGCWQKEGKTVDTQDRLVQSQKMVQVLTRENTPTVLIGDFNMSPEIESFAILKKEMRDLLNEFGYKSTRSKYYSKPDKYADFCLVTRDVKVKNFQVLEVGVSDHEPLLLEIEL